MKDRQLFAYDIEYNIKDNHTTAVENYIESIPPNKLIDDVVPKINSMEETLERDKRTRLAQLRTNKSPFLKSYLNKIDPKSYPSPLSFMQNRKP